MARARTTYRCSDCAHVVHQWFGRCPGCSAWGTLSEETAAGPKKAKAAARESTGAVPITEVAAGDHARMRLGLGELDRVLGGGLVDGSLVLIGGEPGVGKSTLLLAAGAALARGGHRTLYVSAEESESQTRMRAERLDALSDELLLLAETDLNRVLDEVRRHQPRALILDSVQTVFAPELEAAPGSVSQVREVTARLMHEAKTRGLAIFLVGHVTKEGSLAGPKTLEHMVDAVLAFEGSRGAPHRILRAHKNRFGSTRELAVFEMRSSGLLPVENPSALFLAERPAGRPGSAVFAAIEGTRPVLVEVQGLTVDTPLGNPRRTTIGVDATRTALIAAVLERRTGLSLAGTDLFVNVAGGASVDETAADVPVALAIASSLMNLPLDAELVCFGEIGLAGELRGVPRTEERLEEAARLGFSRALIPVYGADKVEVPDGLVVLPVQNLEEALEVALPRG